MKQSKIKRIEFKSEWNGPNGTVHYHSIELENGDKGQIGAKSKLPDKLQVGKEITYESSQDDKGNTKIKLVTLMPTGQYVGGAQSHGKDDSTQKMIVAQNAIGNAIKYCEGKALNTKEVFIIADEIYSWVINKAN